MRAIIHPTVLLSVADHRNRISDASHPTRCVGMLLGEVRGDVVEIMASYPIPFAEDLDHNALFYADTTYNSEIYHMYRRVSTKERAVGWYSSILPGSHRKLQPRDLEIHELLTRDHELPDSSVYVVIDTSPGEGDVPVSVYAATSQDGAQKSWQHVHSEIGFSEAEEIGIETILAEISRGDTTSAAAVLRRRAGGMRVLADRAQRVAEYLEAHVDNVDPEVLRLAQDALGALPAADGPHQAPGLLQLTINELAAEKALAATVQALVATHELVKEREAAALRRVAPDMPFR